jgi:ectoine hydroxylase-related dioxygenase (phytanoyl-CoA dioxygenase family)
LHAVRQRVLVPAGYDPVSLEVPRGAVVFLHGHLLHGSHPNRCERPRRALLATYVRQGSPCRRGETAQRSEIDVYGPRRAS